MKILLVEDDIDLQKVLKKILVMNNFTVECANDGLEALDYLDYESYDLIIMDVLMPNLDGISTLKELRKNKYSIPVLLLTAKSMVEDKVLGLDAGADDYMTKPFQMKELLARIRALTRRVNVIADMNIGDLVLDPNTYELKAKKTVKLTNKEYKIMELLIHNSNTYLSSESIMDALYDISSNTEMGVLWVFISSIRKKLDFIESAYTIKTRKGIGYKLEKKNND